MASEDMGCDLTCARLGQVLDQVGTGGGTLEGASPVNGTGTSDLMLG